MYSNSYCTAPSIDGGIGVGVAISKKLKVLEFLCNGQEAVKEAILYADRSSLLQVLLEVINY